MIFLLILFHYRNKSIIFLFIFQMDSDGSLPFVINLPPPDRFEPSTIIVKLEPNQRQINLLVIVLRIQANPQKTREGHEIHSFKVADRTGSVTLNVWNTTGQLIAPGDILRLQNCITQVFKNELCVKPGRSKKSNFNFKKKYFSLLFRRNYHKSW